MKRFEQILYYTDASEGSRSALERAAGLALRNRGRLTVLGARRLPLDLLLLAPALPPDELWDMATQDLRERPFGAAGRMSKSSRWPTSKAQTSW